MLCKGAQQSRAKLRALPLPSFVFLLGVTASVGIGRLLRFARRGALSEDFDSNVILLAHQVTARMERDLSESHYTAMFLQYSGPSVDSNTLESWRDFTSARTQQNVGGTISWAPRVLSRNERDFYAAARESYADHPGSIRSIRMLDLSHSGEAARSDSGREKAAEDLWPVLFASPSTSALHTVGANIRSVPELARAVDNMIEGNGTTISLISPPLSTGLSTQFAVLQPVFENGDVVGLVQKITPADALCLDALEAAAFVERCPGADVAVFLRVGRVDPEDQLMFGLTASKTMASPPETASRSDRGRSHNFASVIELTDEVSVLLVASFDPNDAGGEAKLALLCACVTSLLVALLVYWRQILLLNYKHGMESAVAMSRFKSRFVADMSHEVRNPLNGIIGTADLLVDEALPANASEMVRTVQACSMILLGIVNDALDVSKIELGQLRVEASPASLRQTLHEVLQIMRSTYRRETAGVLLRLEIDDSVPRGNVLVDVGRIRQVIFNLVSNAFKFTDAGSISVTVRCEPDCTGTRQGSSPPPSPSSSLSSAKEALGSGMGSLAPQSPGVELEAPAGNRLERVADVHAPRVLPASNETGCVDASSGGPIARLWRSVTSEGCRRSRRGRRECHDTKVLYSQSLPPLHNRAMLVVEVTDTGLGMTRDQVENLFKPFYQVHRNPSRVAGGSGLGLAISKSLCESMGGIFGCRSEAGIGSTFFFSVLVGVSAVGAEREDVNDLSGDDARPAEGVVVKPREAEEQAEAIVDGPDGPQRSTWEWNLIAGKRKDVVAGYDTSGGIDHHVAGSDRRLRRRSTRRVNGEYEMGVVELNESRDGSVRGKGSRAIVSSSYPDVDTSSQAAAAAVAAPVTRSDDSWKAPSSSAIAEDAWLASGERHAYREEKKESGAEHLELTLKAAVHGRCPRFLVVDDIRVNRLLVQKMLTALDSEVEVELAENGAEAVEACKKSGFDVILMDVTMPIMGGIEAARAIRAGAGSGVNRTTPIIAISASPTLGEGSERDTTGILDLLVKPITKKSLLGVIGKWASDGDLSRVGAAWGRHPPGQENRAPQQVFFSQESLQSG